MVLILREIYRYFGEKCSVLRLWAESSSKVDAFLPDYTTSQFKIQHSSVSTASTTTRN